MAEKKILGIDLGTTNSAVAIWSKDGRPQIIPNRQGHSLTPSVVAVAPTGDGVVVGHQALAIAQQTPSLAVFSVLRYVGRRFDDEWVQQWLQISRAPYRVEPERSGEGIEIILGDRRLTPQQVLAIILRKLKADAEAYLDSEITEAVIAVPAYFVNSQRQAIREAARMADLDIRSLVNEPVAAYLAFGYGRSSQERKTVFVYDLGGGTFDISVLEVERGLIRTRALGGDTHLGGNDFDHAIVDWVLSTLGDEVERDLRQDAAAMFRLRQAAEQAKIVLSDAESVQVQVPGPLSSSDVRDLEVHLTRATLEELTRPYIDRTLHVCAKALADARITASDVDEVLLAGGQTRMPAVRAAVRDFFGTGLNTNVNPEDAVALGAAVQAAVLSGEITTVRTWDVVPHTLGLDTGGKMEAIIPRNTPVPVVKSRVFTTTQDNQESIEFTVYEGEQPLVADNVRLGAVTLELVPAPAGQPEIEVTFQVDRDNILRVRAMDARTGSVTETVFTDYWGFGEEETARITPDTEEPAPEYPEMAREGDVQDRPGETPENGSLAPPIEELLASLRDLLDKVTVARETARTLETELKAAQDDYDRALGPLDQVAIELGTRRDNLRARLARESLSGLDETLSSQAPPVPPPAESVTTPATSTLSSEIEIREERKRELADHVMNFIDSGQDGLVANLNAMIFDARTDVGDMLEILPWGTVWTDRTDWETPEDQYERLTAWYAALSQRSDYWQQTLAHLETNPLGALWQEKNARSDEQWQSFLQGLAARREEENQHLAREVTQLEERIRGDRIRHVWLYMAAGQDERQIDLLERQDRVRWGANRYTRASDIVLMYRTAPYSDVAYLFRAASDAQEAEKTAGWQWDYAIDLEEKAILERPVTLNEIRTHPHLADWSLARSPQGAMRRRKDIREEGYWEAVRGLLVAWNPPLAETLADWEGLERAELLASAVGAARAIEDEEARAEALVGLGPHLPEEALGEIVAAARAIGSNQPRAEVLVGLAPHLPQHLMGEALRVARAIDIGGAKASALAALAPHLPQNLMAEALEAARELGDQRVRARALVGLAPHLPQDLLGQALAAAQAMEDEVARAKALAGLLPRLSEEAQRAALEDALEAVQSIEDEASRAEALTYLLEAIQAIEDEEARADALVDLAPLLPQDLLSEALETARAIERAHSRSEALASLAPYLPQELLGEALTAVRAIDMGLYTAKALVVMAPHLQQGLLDEALATARQIEEQRAKALALAGLLPRLSEEAQRAALEEASEAALSIEDEASRAAALADILAAAQAIEDDASRADAPTILARTLSRDRDRAAQTLDLAFQRAEGIEDDESRSEALGFAARVTAEIGVSQEVSEDWLISRVEQIQDETIRAEALAKIVTTLAHTGEPDQAFAVALAVEDEESRARALAALAPQLTGEARAQAITVAAMLGETQRSRVLVALAPTLTGELRDRAWRLAKAMHDFGNREQVLAALGPDFAGLIREKTQDFTGREWALDEIGRWLADPAAPPFFMITGEPGCGKTALAARLTRIPSVTAHHFCIAGRPETVDPRAFVRTLIRQLINTKPNLGPALLQGDGPNIQVSQNVSQLEAGARVVGLKVGTLNLGALSPQVEDSPPETLDVNQSVGQLESGAGLVGVESNLLSLGARVQISQSIARMEPGATLQSMLVDQVLLPDAPLSEIFRRFVIEPLERQAQPSTPVVIVVDGLDIALMESTGESIVDLIASTPDLAPQISFILTARPGRNVTARFEPRFSELLLDPQRAENLADVRAFIERRVDSSETLRKWMADEGLESSKFLSSVIQTSEGNFGRVHDLLAAAERGEPVPFVFPGVEPPTPASAPGLQRSVLEHFVDREAELHALDRMLSGQTPEQLWMITGPTGAGKSWLLQRLHRTAIERTLPTALVDLGDPADRLVIVNRIATQLGESWFPRLAQTLEEAANLEVGSKIENGLSGPTIQGDIMLSGAADPAILKAVEARVNDAFFADLADLGKQSMVLLLFDTYERAPHGVADWIVKQLCRRLSERLLPGVLAVISGQVVPELPPAWRIEGFTTLLDTLPREAVYDYWVDRRGLPIDAVTAVWEFSKGLPGLVARMADNYLLQAGQPLTSLERLSPSVGRALRWAEGLRRATGAGYVYTEYLLAGLYQEIDGYAQHLLTLFDSAVTLEPKLQEVVNAMTNTNLSLGDIRPADSVPPDQLLLSPNLEDSMVEATHVADMEGSDQINSRHAMIGLLAGEAGVAGDWIAGLLQVERGVLAQLIFDAPGAFPPLDEIRQVSARSRPAPRTYLLGFRGMQQDATVSEIAVADIFDLHVDLVPAPSGTEGSFALPPELDVLYGFVSADGLSVVGDEVKVLRLREGTGQLKMLFRLQADLVGTRTCRIEFHSEDPGTGRSQPLFQDRQRLPKYTIQVRPPRVGEERPPILPALNVHLAPQPTLVLQVQANLLEQNLVGSPARYRLVYFLTSPLPLNGQRLRNAPAGHVDLSSVDLERLQTIVDLALAHTGGQPEDVRARMLALGAYLYDHLFPADTARGFRQALQQLGQDEWGRLQGQRGGARPTWLIVEDPVTPLWMPWELLAVPNDGSDGPPRFLCELFYLSRWIQGLGPPLYGEIPVTPVALVSHDPGLVEWQSLLGSGTPLRLLHQVLDPDTPVFTAHLVRSAESLLKQTDIVPRENQPPEPQTATVPPQEQQDDEPAVRRRPELRRKRLVIGLGMVRLGDPLPAARNGRWLLPGQALSYLRAGASAVIAPWWATSMEADRVFWPSLYSLLNRYRVSLGEAVWRARQEVQRALPGQSDWLAYTLFGDPRARPYQPKHSEGYTALECLEPEEDGTLRPGRAYDFRVSISTRPPFWHEGRVVLTEALPSEPRATFVVPEWQDKIPEPVVMEQDGPFTVQTTVPFTPREEGDYQLLVHLQDGKQRLQWLQLDVRVQG